MKRVGGEDLVVLEAAGGAGSLHSSGREGGRVSGSGQGSNTNEAGGPEPGQCGGLTTVTNL